MEKKKFKLNIIDIIIIIVIAAAVIFLGSKVLGKAFVSGQDYTVRPTHTYHITLYTDRVANYVLDSTEVGDKAYDYTDETELGKVVSVERGDCIEYEIENGEYVTMVCENYSSAYITLEVKGQESDHGVEINDTIYAAGHTFVLYAGQGKYYLPVYSVEQVD